MLAFSLKKNFQILLLLLSLMVIPSLHAQSKKENYIKHKLTQIDSLIEINEFSKAIKLIQTTQNTFTFKSDDDYKLELDYRYAQILYEKGEEDKALEIFLRGFDLLEVGDNSKLYINYVNFLTRIFANTKNFDKAIQYNKISLKRSKKEKDTSNILRSLIRLGSFYYAKENIDSAKYYYKRVYYYPQNRKTEQRISNAYNNLSVIAQYEDNYPLAKSYAKKALKIKINQQDTLGIVSSNINLGNLNYFYGDYQNAKYSYLEALVPIKNDTTPKAYSAKKLIYDNLAVAYDSLKDYKNAYQYALQSRRLNKKIQEYTINNNLAEVEAKFNLAKEEQKTEAEKAKTFRAQVMFYGAAFITITLMVLAVIFYKNYKLKEQNRLEQLQIDVQTRIINATIDAKEKERKTIAEILHDSVSALLSSANLHLQASQAQLNSKAPIEISKAQDIVKEASVKIRDLSHELISSVLMKFGLAFAVHDLCEKYSNSKLSLHSDANGVKRYNQQFEIKIYHIIEELVNNIIKHSGASKASITLVERNGEKLLIQIIDDGKGFDVTKERKKEGLGLSHIEARVKVMQGVFNINSKKGEGTSIFISVPIYKSVLKAEVI